MNAANTYKTQQIMTAPPEELTLMLYNGAIKFISEAIIAVEAKDIACTNRSSRSAQAIVQEFMNTLDMQYDLSKDLMALYVYVNKRLVWGNIKKDRGQLEEARTILKSLRDAWVEAIKRYRAERPQAMAR
jgi:flagellar protein FliS